MKKIWDLVGSNEQECSFIKKEEYDNKNILSDEFGYEFHRLGFSISVDCNSLLIKNIFFFSKNYGKGYVEYMGDLPFGVDFDEDKCSVRKNLGIPSFYRDSFKSVLGLVPPLDSYFYNNKNYSIEYLPDCSGIRMMCVFVDA